MLLLPRALSYASSHFTAARDLVHPPQAPVSHLELSGVSGEGTCNCSLDVCLMPPNPSRSNIPRAELLISTLPSPDLLLGLSSRQ